MVDVRYWETVDGDGNVTHYHYVQSTLGNYAVQAKMVKSIVEQDTRTGIRENLTKPEVEELFRRS
jgi:hypothetical protein